ncbi:MAG: hypothetical protein HXN79_05620 [Prevotella pallens]|uniref:hypothetical protein n=1 Tax=Prevotella pallens TaxID=60133 RepID=UPI001CB476EE|nr:hypothetical protein [Prevotella pallens]MBF1487786.1 hypothetical protein [Prevotella pallens]
MKVIKRRSYKEPQCSVICIKTESLLNNASGNAGSIQPGPSAGDAKQNNIWDDMEENS